jgi:hypothetical protein
MLERGEQRKRGETKMIDEKRIETTPVQHIRNLVSSIKDEKLTITYYDPIEPSYTRTYDVSCNAEDADEFVLKYKALVRALEAIGKVREKLNSGAKLEEVLSREQIDVWNTYICDFDEVFDAGEYDLDELYVRRAAGDELNDEEHEALERHYELFEEQCLKRLPKRAYPSKFLVNRAQRYEYLISGNAPECVIDEEGRCLAEEMILYYAVR